MAAWGQRDPSGRTVMDRPIIFARNRAKAAEPQDVTQVLPVGKHRSQDDQNKVGQSGQCGQGNASPTEEPINHVGRKTGIMVRAYVRKDSSGMENLAEFWDAECERGQEEAPASGPDPAVHVAKRRRSSSKTCNIPSTIHEESFEELRAVGNMSGSSSSSSSSARSERSKRRNSINCRTGKSQGSSRVTAASPRHSRGEYGSDSATSKSSKASSSQRSGEHATFAMSTRTGGSGTESIHSSDMDVCGSSLQSPSDRGLQDAEVRKIRTPRMNVYSCHSH